MCHIWKEMYLSLFSVEIDLVSIGYLGKKWRPKHWRVFGSETTDSNCPFRPLHLPSHFFLPKPISFNPSSSPLAQTKAQCNGPFFFFLFFSFLQLPSAPSPITHLHASTSHLLTFHTQAISPIPSPIFLPCYQLPCCQPLLTATLPPGTSSLQPSHTFHHH